MAQHLIAMETSDCEKDSAGEKKMTSCVAGSRLGKTALIGVAMVTAGVLAISVKGIWSSKKLRANPESSILEESTAVDSCFEDKVAYKLGGVKQGTSKWVLAEEKRDSPHECQFMCQSLAACEFFTFKPRTKKCIATTARGEKLKKGQKAVSGPRYCPGASHPCKQYLAPSSSWTLTGPGNVELLTHEYTSQLNGQKVKFNIYGGEEKVEAWEQPQANHNGIVDFPTWPKEMPPNYPMIYRVSNPPKSFNITVEGDPIENMILGFFFAGERYTGWKLTLSDGIWIPVNSGKGWFHANFLDNGRTLFLEGTGMQILAMYRLSKPVSKVSITSEGLGKWNTVYTIHTVVFQGKQC